MTYHHPLTWLREIAAVAVISSCGGLGLGLLADALAPKPAKAWRNEVRTIERAIEGIGSRVLWAKGGYARCSNTRLLGYYSPEERKVIMCQSNLVDNSDVEIVDTMRHEGWHAVQFICNEAKTVLSDQQLRDGMKPSDKRILRKFYSANQHRLEAEARVVAQLPTSNFLKGVKAYCR